MEDKRKLMAAIMGAIITYTQTEQQPSSATPEAKPQPEASQQQHNPTTNNAK